MMPAHKRRWFAFKLRTMFVAVAVFGCLLWLGMNLRKVRERQFLMEVGALKYVVSNSKHPSRPLPLVWSLMGAEPIASMKIFSHEDEDQNQRWFLMLTNLFPEADISFGWTAGDYGGEVDDEDMGE
jgi:hypothetical protein